MVRFNRNLTPKSQRSFLGREKPRALCSDTRRADGTETCSPRQEPGCFGKQGIGFLSKDSRHRQPSAWHGVCAQHCRAPAGRAPWGAEPHGAAAPRRPRLDGERHKLRSRQRGRDAGRDPCRMPRGKNGMHPKGGKRPRASPRWVQGHRRLTGKHRGGFCFTDVQNSIPIRTTGPILPSSPMLLLQPRKGACMASCGGKSSPRGLLEAREVWSSHLRAASLLESHLGLRPKTHGSLHRHRRMPPPDTSNVCNADKALGGGGGLSQPCRKGTCTAKQDGQPSSSAHLPSCDSTLLKCAGAPASEEVAANILVEQEAVLFGEEH